MDSQENDIFDKIGKDEPIQIDDLAQQTGQTTFSLLSVLLQMEMKGLVQQLPGKYFKRK